MEHETALVTGGARSIGRACCEDLLKSGHRVIFLDTDKIAAEAFLRETASTKLHYLYCDVSDSHCVKQVCLSVLERFGPVSVLVNNAGIQTHCLFADMTEALWDETLSVNLKSAFWVCKWFIPGMIQQGYGRIINIASMSARRGSRQHVHYCASKAGLLGFTRALSLEVACDGITVNAICPGIVETQIIQDTLPEKRDIWLHEMHVKRLGTPKDISNAVCFLADQASSWITGQAFDVNGGIVTP